MLQNQIILVFTKDTFLWITYLENPDTHIMTASPHSPPPATPTHSFFMAFLNFSFPYLCCFLRAGLIPPCQVNSLSMKCKRQLQSQSLQIQAHIPKLRESYLLVLEKRSQEFWLAQPVYLIPGKSLIGSVWIIYPSVTHCVVLIDCPSKNIKKD